MKATNEIKMQFASRSTNEMFARVAIAAFVLPLDPTVEELADIKTAVSEAVTNCIVHAYPDQLGMVHLTARLYDRRLVVTVKDTGVGIEDIAQAMTPMYTSSPDAERAGLGFAVMESFMDKLRVRSHPGKGTTVTMEKRIADRSSLPQATAQPGRKRGRKPKASAETSLGDRHA